MKKYLSLTLMAVMMAVTVPMLTACGDDDDDETEQGVAVGTHRIDVSFSGDTQGWDVGLTFLTTAYYANGTPFPGMYENIVRRLLSDKKNAPEDFGIASEFF